MDRPGIEVRLHATTLYNSLYRFDQSLLVNTHAYGALPRPTHQCYTSSRFPAGGFSITTWSN